MRRKYLNTIFWFFLLTLGLFTLLGMGGFLASLLGYVEWKNGAISAVGSVLGIGTIRSLYLEFLQKELLPSDAVGKLEEQLKLYFRDRLSTVSAVGNVENDTNLVAMSTKLMVHFLSFLESRLRLRSPNTNFEISVFANVEEPEIICYYDSGGSTKPSSADSRQNNPQFYRENKYEAVELLESPSSGSEVIVISRTEKKSTYSFRAEEQRSRIKSTVLCSFVDPEPIVIVLVANEPDIFDEEDAPLKDLVIAAVMSVAHEMNVCKAIRFPSQPSLS